MDSKSDADATLFNECYRATGTMTILARNSVSVVECLPLSATMTISTTMNDDIRHGASLHQDVYVQ